VNNKAVITSTVGYMCLSLTGWMLSMPNAGWFDKLYGHGVAMMLAMAIVLGVMGILAFLNERTLDSVIFFGGAGIFWTGYVYMTSSSGATDPGHYTGWYFFIWSVYFCYVWLGSFKAGLERMLFLLGLWLTLLALAIGEWGDIHFFTVLGGYLGLATSILAAITSAIAVITHGFGGLDVRSSNSTKPAA
jgi:succinate-acetate transporter protein